MASVVRMNLSGSTDGKGINLAATSTPGNLIHTATSSTTPGAGVIWDEIWLWISYDTLNALPEVTIEFGDATAPDHNIRFQPQYHSTPRLIVAGMILQNSTTVRGFASATLTGNAVVTGYVNRITN